MIAMITDRGTVVDVGCGRVSVGGYMTGNNTTVCAQNMCSECDTHGYNGHSDCGLMSSGCRM